MPRKVDPSELSPIIRQILERVSDPKPDLNDLWVTTAEEAATALVEVRAKYGLETAVTLSTAKSTSTQL